MYLNWTPLIFFSVPLHFTLKVKLILTSFGEQFSYLEKHVSKDARKAGVTETPCNYGDKVCMSCNGGGCKCRFRVFIKRAYKQVQIVRQK